AGGGHIRVLGYLYLLLEPRQLAALRLEHDEPPSVLLPTLRERLFPSPEGGKHRARGHEVGGGVGPSRSPGGGRVRDGAVPHVPDLVVELRRPLPPGRYRARSTARTLSRPATSGHVRITN